MTRLFTFGCSFTDYAWPTWADIMAKSFDKSFNYGQEGAGNHYIFNSLVEANMRHKIGPDDTVAIMWTNVSREDRYVKRRWLNTGNVFSHPMYSKKWLKEFADIRGYYIRDLAMMWAADFILQNLGCRVIYLSMVDIMNPLQHEHNDYSGEIADLLIQYESLLQKIKPSIHAVVFNYDWNSRPNYMTHDYMSFLMHQTGKDRSWAQWYNTVRSGEWPDCETEDNFKNLPFNIQQECIKTFKYQPSENTNTSRPPLKGKRLGRVDLHACPAEHLEYLDKILPEFFIAHETRQWIAQIQTLMDENQDISHLWSRSYQPRW